MARIWGQIKSSKPMSRIKQICYHVKCEHGKTKDSPTEREEGIKQKQKVKNAQNDKHRWICKN